MSLFGNNAADVFSSPTLNTGGISTTGGYATSSSPTIVDRLFGSATDYIGQFIDYNTKIATLKEQTKFQMAKANSQNMLNHVGQPPNINASPQPLYIPTNTGNTGGGIDKNMILLAAVAFAGFMLIK